jgi:hypothetical protein
MKQENTSTYCLYVSQHVGAGWAHVDCYEEPTSSSVIVNMEG